MLPLSQLSRYSDYFQKDPWPVKNCLLNHILFDHAIPSYQVYIMVFAKFFISKFYLMASGFFSRWLEIAAGQNAQSVISSVICVGATAGMMALVKSNGRQICSRPRLCGLL